MIESVQHWLLPSKRNRFKARLIRFEGLIAISVVLLLLQSLLSYSSKHISVLGYASQISTEEVIRLVNIERSNQGLNTLELNSSLAEAANMKGKDMLEDGYWAHVSPDGTDPWYFFSQVKYSYRYAGENLARDFSNPTDAVSAWMASPSHRENILSDKYKEIGIAVVEGDLNGEDTTIIVQLFGTSSADRIPVIPVAAAENEEGSSQLGISEVGAEEEKVFLESIAKKPDVNITISPVVSPLIVSRNVSLGILAVLFIVLIADLFYIEQNGITRKSSRALAHISFFTMILVILIMARAGEIL